MTRDFISSFEDLFTRKSGVIKPGLERVRAAKALLSFEPLPFTILIGGTNGKGSLCGHLFQLCSAAGLHVGLFTSPHIHSFAERILTSATRPSDRQLFSLLQDLERELRETAQGQAVADELSFFEWTTLLSLKYFTKKPCDMVILEVGLGGRLDSTNIIDAEMAAITSIDFDHEAWLGSTLKAIASEKLAIFRKNQLSFWGESKERTASEKLLDECEFAPQKRGEHFGIDGETFFHKDASMKVHPEWLCSPMAEAGSMGAAMFREMIECGVLPKKAETTMHSYFTHPPMPGTPVLAGRFQMIARGANTMIFDVAHNPAAISLLVKKTKSWLSGRAPQKLTIWFGAMRDKSWKTMVDILLTLSPHLNFIDLENERALNKCDFISVFKDLHAFSSFDEAMKDLDASANHLFTGSFVTVAKGLKFFGTAI